MLQLAPITLRKKSIYFQPETRIDLDITRRHHPRRSKDKKKGQIQWKLAKILRLLRIFGVTINRVS